MLTTNIRDEDRALFDAMMSGKYDNFALFSCFCNGKPSVAIVYVNETDDGRVDITPLWVRHEPDQMILTNHEGVDA